MPTGLYFVFKYFPSSVIEISYFSIRIILIYNAAPFIVRTKLDYILLTYFVHPPFPKQL